MLKLIYTENSFTLERLEESLEAWVNTRVILSLHSATSFHIKSSTAAFLIRDEEIKFFKTAKSPSSPRNELENVSQENLIDICRCDAEYLEVTFKGVWMTSDIICETGVFVTNLSPSAELLFQKLSQSGQFCHA
ncbi:MAG: hypothetical protein KME60_26935 [Cyanomargarita calcarea GSE-NOS-MK-12-04C]|jgi:hypothetical protein|uniref:Uncharacterized protein n=1 Tax=Cyanomargarita calcarea GSE-NOS-MK-12-04C TaxID=2839659 RepID=A0A951QR60_9CYAN|nr:hypothetical protein [Cyanomargarita calcarea GSE-NOS-MK-12-04C]